MAKVCPLFSGSSGNSTYIACSEGGILVDAGVSAKAITQALERHGVEAGSLKAIFVTHEHSDHISGIRVLASRHGIPVFASPGTAAAMEDFGILQGKVAVQPVEPGEPVSVAGMEIRSFSTYHDCRQSVGYTVTLPDERRVELIDGVIYDMATPSEEHQLILNELSFQLNSFVKLEPIYNNELIPFEKRFVKETRKMHKEFTKADENLRQMLLHRRWKSENPVFPSEDTVSARGYRKVFQAAD